MIKKYELTDETTKIWCEKTLHSIRALRDFGDVKAGQLGGWIESEDDLSHPGDAWVAYNEMFFGRSRIVDSAQSKIEQ